MIYIICVLEIDEEKQIIKSKRTIGYYYEFIDAENEVINNSFDMFESNFNYAIIEGFTQGLYRTSQNEKWFKAHRLTKTSDAIMSILPVDKPKFLENTTSFGIG